MGGVCWFLAAPFHPAAPVWPGLLPLECNNHGRGSPPLCLFGGQLNGSDPDTSVQIHEFDFGGSR